MGLDHMVDSEMYDELSSTFISPPVFVGSLDLFIFVKSVSVSHPPPLNKFPTLRGQF